MKWIGWRTDSVGPNGRPTIEFTWHAQRDLMSMNLDTGFSPVECLSALDMNQVKVYRFEGDRPQGRICDRCLGIVKAKIAHKRGNVLPLR